MKKILFVCTHNRCRSILAEAVTNQIAAGSLEARSAGSEPAGVVHPLSLQYLEEADISTAGLSSQSWDVHEDWQPDIVITVCDRAAGESCPVWLGKSIKIHWGLADPSTVAGSNQDIACAFQHTIRLLAARIHRLLKHNLNTLSDDELAGILSNLSTVEQ